MNFDGKVVIVTGAGGGIGEGTASALAEAGAHVGVVDNDGAAAEAVANRINGVAATADIADPEAVEAAVAKIADRLGTPTILVNCAGTVAGAAPIAELPLEILDRALAVNVRGTILMTQAVLRRMLAAGLGGAIVNVSSIGARARPFPGLGHYEATKAAIDALTRSAALELAPHDIRVNAVAPGVVHTGMTHQLAENPSARAAIEARIPLGRIGVPADLAPVIMMLASDDARYVTGTVVTVDGGHLLT